AVSGSSSGGAALRYLSIVAELPAHGQTAGGRIEGAGAHRNEEIHRPSQRRPASAGPCLLRQTFGAGTRPREELEWVDQLAVCQDLVVKVPPGRSSCGPHETDDVAALHFLARLDIELAQVGIAGGKAEL